MISAVNVPAVVLDQARAFFENCGINGSEGTAMIKAGPAGVSLVIPDQTPVRTQHGVSVEVTRAGQMNLALALGKDELYVSRIHSHPGEAFHSPTDDANPALTYDGALSIVVPFFGLGLRRGFDACAVYRLETQRWRALSPGPQRSRWITIVDPT
ncbi:Mov34/MPN/PAD-1 family protein [Acidothermaceae bacterium B102]|nr:Mov34/MPN/PAD-1 family protein [Acidothermaceae bacterium B102]